MKTILLACAAMAVATGANAATFLFDFSLAPHRDNVGATETYTTGGLSIFASGFTAAGAAADLWGKHGGGDENGLGLANDPSGQHEIHFGSGFVQLDMSNLFGKVNPATLMFGTNSTTGGEVWKVYGTNTAGSIAGAAQVATGSNEGNHLLPSLGTYRYYDFVETARAGGQNFLITSVSGATVPEPAGWALMIVGFGGLGVMLRRRRALAVIA